MKWATILSVLAVVGFGAASSFSETKVPEAPAYTTLRWDEDYSYLKDPAARKDYLDALKYIPLGESSYLSLGGQARYRYEFFNNNTFGAGPQDDDGYHLTRLLLDGDLHLGSNLRFFVQGKSSMIDGRTGGPRSNDADEFDLEQAFADVILPLADTTKLTFRLGRQEMKYGGQRVIGPSDWSNARRTFEGVKVMLATPGNSVDLFWVRPVPVDKEEPNDGDGDTSFAGIYDTLPLPRVLPGANTKLEMYGLALNRTANASHPADSDIYTLGARFSAQPKPWDIDVEADWQFGDFDSRSVGAYALAIEAGYTFADIALSPRLYLGFDIASGAEDPAHRYNQLFPTGHTYFGYIDVIGRQNIMDLHAGLALKLNKDVLLKAEPHFFWRQNVDDAVYNASGNVLRADTGSDAAYIGSEIDLVLSWQIDRHLSAYVGYSHFFAGDFIEQTGAADDIDFIYAAMMFTF